MQGLPLLPHRPGVALPRPRLRRLLDVGRLRREDRRLRRTSRRDPRRLARRAGGGAPDRLRDGLAHALRARSAPPGRDGPHQLRRQRHRLGRSAAGEHGRRDDHRHGELRREARAGCRAGNAPRHQPHARGCRRRGHAADGRRGRGSRVRARRRRPVPEGARLARQGRPPCDLRRSRGRGRALRHHPLLPQPEADHRLLRLQPGRGGALHGARGAGHDHAARPQGVPTRRGARGDGHDGAPRTLRKDRPHA